MQGILLSVPEGTESIDTMRRLWAHEILRIYGDRLVDDADKNWLFNTLCEVIKERMDLDPSDLFARLAQPGQEVRDAGNFGNSNYILFYR